MQRIAVTTLLAFLGMDLVVVYAGSDANSTPELKIEGSSTAIPNEPYILKVEMDDDVKGARGLQFDITFNPPLCGSNSTSVQFLQGTFSTKQFNVLPSGAVRLVEFNSNALTNDGPLDIVSIACKVSNLQPGTKVNIGFDPQTLEIDDITGAKISGVSGVGMQTEIIAVTKGDLNKDGKVDIFDLQIKADCLSGRIVCTPEQQFADDVFPPRDPIQGRQTCGDGIDDINDLLALIDITLVRTTLLAQCG